MQPTQPQQPHQAAGPGPQPPYRPPEYSIDPNLPPQRPGFGGVAPLRQHPEGSHDVVPALATSPNNGHSGHNPYEFIVQPNTPKRSHNPLSGMSFGKEIALFIGGAIVVVIILAIVVSALAPKSSTPGLIAIAQRQQEIIRVATEAEDQVTSQAAKNFVINTELSLISSQAQMLAYLQTHGTKVDSKVLALDQDAQTDTLLTNAQSANNYDSTVTQTLSDQLGTYQSLLQTNYKQTSSKTAKALLQSGFTAAQTLLEQAKSTQSASS